MRCRACGSDLVHRNGAGEPLIRNRGLVLKADGPALICPKCKADVPVTPDLAKVLQDRIALLFRSPPKPPAKG